MKKKLVISLFYSAIFSALFFACTRDLGKSTLSDDIVIYPPPPDTTRIQYLTSISTSADIKGRQSEFNKFVMGEEVPIPLIKPYGITVNGSKIYICDSGLGGLVNIDLSNKDFRYFIPAGKGQLQLPLNCAVDENGYLYVADGNRRQIVIFDSEGKYVKAIGDTAESFKPTDVTIKDNFMYVASVKDQKIFVYEKNTDSLMFSFPGLEPDDDGYLFQPVNLCIDSSFIYVSDLGDNTIKVYSLDGDFLRSTGGYGTMAGKFMRPKGLTVDRESNLYVVDAAFENVQIFNNEGDILMFFGGPYRKHGDMYLPADVTVSYTGLEYFSSYVDESFNLKYLIFVTNQYGPDKISVYGFVEMKP